MSPEGGIPDEWNRENTCGQEFKQCIVRDVRTKPRNAYTTQRRKDSWHKNVTLRSEWIPIQTGNCFFIASLQPLRFARIIQIFLSSLKRAFLFARITNIYDDQVLSMLWGINRTDCIKTGIRFRAIASIRVWCGCVCNFTSSFTPSLRSQRCNLERGSQKLRKWEHVRFFEALNFEKLWPFPKKSEAHMCVLWYPFYDLIV